MCDKVLTKDKMFCNIPLGVIKQRQIIFLTKIIPYKVYWCKDKEFTGTHTKTENFELKRMEEWENEH
jgi:hypothetical protein